jgi:hypothetical protein
MCVLCTLRTQVSQSICNFTHYSDGFHFADVVNELLLDVTLRALAARIAPDAVAPLPLCPLDGTPPVAIDALTWAWHPWSAAAGR